MNAKDLRIGNFWDTGDFYGIDRVESYNIYQFSLMEKGSTVADFYHHVKPIPLTEEWLLKFGFIFLKEKDGTQGVYSSGKMNLILSNSGIVYTTRNKCIPYVHTLQNHYYFTLLTGEELTLTTPAL